MVVVFLIFAKEPCWSKGIDERRESIPSYNNCSPLQKSLLRRAFFYKYIEFLFLIELIFRCLDCLVSQDSLILLITADFATKICMGKRRIIQIFIIFVVGWEFLALRW